MGSKDLYTAGRLPWPLIHLLGRVPQVNDTVVTNDLELTVKSADERRAKEVLVRPINSQESSADQA